MDGQKILVVESDPRTAELAKIKLSNAGYWVIGAMDGEEALQKVLENELDLVVMSPSLAKKDGFEVCSEIRKNPSTSNLPIILLIDESFNEEQLNTYGIKFDDILVKPFTPKHLLFKANSVLANARLLKEINPLTKLPGRNHIQGIINTKIASGEKFSLIFTDLKDFKVFNKQYGFSYGDQLITKLCAWIQEEILNCPEIKTEIYHFGGDDFCILVENGSAPEISEKILERFDQEIPKIYQEEDRHRGGLVMVNRQGFVEQWPIMTIALAVVSNVHRHINEWLEAEGIGMELIKFAKSKPGSQIAIDRRHS